MGRNHVANVADLGVKTGFSLLTTNLKPAHGGMLMPRASVNRPTRGYALATGEAADYRLQVLHELYGPGTRRVLVDAGIKPGMRVADLGCGVGMVTAMLSELVGRFGQVTGVDASSQQLTRAQERLGSSTNARFVEANASETGMQPLSFDMVYCRFLLIHLPDPESALREMWNLLCPGGVIVCEDGDLTSAGSAPPTALGAFADLWGRLAPSRGVDYTLGSRLFQMVMAAGFTAPEVTFNQPVRVRGEGKRLLELSVAEAGDAFVEAGLITAEELDLTLAKMRLATADESVLAVMPRMTQVWARKPASR
jgi:SAM-dependent methyltransferase